MKPHSSPYSKRIFLASIAFLLVLSLGCRTFTDLATPPPAPTDTRQPTQVPTDLPQVPVQPGEENPDEPVFITGDIPYTSPFFLSTISEPFVLLEDEAGFVERNWDFTFRLESQAIGAVEIHEDNTLTYSLALPAVPQGTQVDVDQDGDDETGVQVFAVAYWSNTWGGPFLERRDGTGWSTAYSSAITDPEREHEIVGGTLVVWAPDEAQSFPTGFGEDGLLFTGDDPTDSIPAGYNFVDLDEEPFRVYKSARASITLQEGEIAVNDFSSMSYGEAFLAMLEKAQKEYPFSAEKNIDWKALKDKYEPLASNANNDDEFFNVIHDFTQEIPDGHVGTQLNPQVFFEKNGGGLGIAVAELSDGRVLVTHVIPGTPAAKAGIQVGAEIITWNDQPVLDALRAVNPYFGPYSTEDHRKVEQAVFLTRMPPGTRVELSYINPGSTEKQANLESEPEYGSLFASHPFFNKDPLIVPIEGEVLDESGLGYIRVNTFLADYSLMARLWDHFMKTMTENQVPGLIIDLRSNSGGSGSLAMNFASYFFNETATLYSTLYFNELTGSFEGQGLPSQIEPAPLYFEGPIAVLVSPYCVSACEGFAYALSQDERSIIVGNFPTAGAFGEVGRGQYTLPGDLSMQFPTGRHVTPDGELVIEGTGVLLDITVPVTEESALGKDDTMLNAAIQALLDKIQ